MCNQSQNYNGEDIALRVVKMDLNTTNSVVPVAAPLVRLQTCMFCTELTSLTHNINSLGHFGHQMGNFWEKTPSAPPRHGYYVTVNVIIILKVFNDSTQVQMLIPVEAFQDVSEDQHKVGIVAYNSDKQFTVRSNHHLSKCVECLVDC